MLEAHVTGKDEEARQEARETTEKPFHITLLQNQLRPIEPHLHLLRQSPEDAQHCGGLGSSTMETSLQPTDLGRTTQGTPAVITHMIISKLLLLTEPRDNQKLGNEHPWCLDLEF